MKIEHLALAFGRLGFLFHQRAQGIDSTPVHPLRAVPALELEQVLPEDSNDYELLRSVLRDLCERAGEQLREKKQRAARVEVRVRYADYEEDGHKLKLAPPLQSSAALYARALPVLDEILRRRTRVRSMHLRLTDLSFGSVQLDLFADPQTNHRPNLELALDTLRHRYGKLVVVQGRPAELRMTNDELRINPSGVCHS